MAVPGRRSEPPLAPQTQGRRNGPSVGVAGASACRNKGGDRREEVTTTADNSGPREEEWAEYSNCKRIGLQRKNCDDTREEEKCRRFLHPAREEDRPSQETLFAVGRFKRQTGDHRTADAEICKITRRESRQFAHSLVVELAALKRGFH